MRKHPAVAALVWAAAMPMAPTALADSVSVDLGKVSVVMTDEERSVLSDWYRTRVAAPPQDLPPGLRKKIARGGSLPPGWQKKIARGQVIPNDIWAFHEPVPADVIPHLPRQPEGTILVRIDNQIVRVAVATMVVLDAFGVN